MSTNHNSAHAPSRPLTDEGGALDFSTFVDGFAQDVQGFVRAEKRYILMQASEKAGGLMGKTVGMVVPFLACIMALLFLCIGLGFYLGEVVGSRALGFVMVGGLYLILLGIFQLWWNSGGRDRFILGRINELNDDDHETQKP
ncbi:MAG: phage holin family protein [Flavobacteriales bacterium]